MGNYASDKKNSRHFPLKFSRSGDEDVIEKLDSVENKQGYIRSLIRADIAAGQGSGGGAAREFGRRVIVFEGVEYELVCYLQRARNTFEVYIAPADGSFSLENMFGLKVEDVNGDIETALDIGERNASEHLRMCLEHWI